jgi:hypothetical protein
MRISSERAANNLTEGKELVSSVETPSSSCVLFNLAQAVESASEVLHSLTTNICLCTKSLLRFENGLQFFSCMALVCIDRVLELEDRLRTIAEYGARFMADIELHSLFASFIVICRCATITHGEIQCLLVRGMIRIHFL